MEIERAVRCTDLLVAKNIQVRMNGRGRMFEHILIERLWRMVQYEKVYLSGFQSVQEVDVQLKAYFEFYNHARLHQIFDYRTRTQVYAAA